MYSYVNHSMIKEEYKYDNITIYVVFDLEAEDYLMPRSYASFTTRQPSESRARATTSAFQGFACGRSVVRAQNLYSINDSTP